MHYALAVPDIQQEILGHLHLSTCTPDVSACGVVAEAFPDKKALVSLAYTCHELSRAALPVLWRQMKDLRPLLKLISEYVEPPAQTYAFAFANDPTRRLAYMSCHEAKLPSSSLERFILYASFVRDFHWIMDDYPINADGYRLILSSLPSETPYLLPELRSLHIVRHSADSYAAVDYTLLPPLLGPLTHLRQLCLGAEELSPSLAWVHDQIQNLSVSRLTTFHTSIRTEASSQTAAKVISQSPGLRRLVIERGCLDDNVAEAVRTTGVRLRTFQCANFVPRALAKVLGAVKDTLISLRVTGSPVGASDLPLSLPIFENGFPVLQCISLPFLDWKHGILAALCASKLPSLDTLSLHVPSPTPSSTDPDASAMAYIADIMSSSKSQLGPQISSLHLSVGVFHMTADWEPVVLGVFPHLRLLSIVQSNHDGADWWRYVKIGSFAAMVGDDGQLDATMNLERTDGLEAEKGKISRSFVYDLDGYDVFNAIFGFHLGRWL